MRNDRFDNFNRQRDIPSSDGPAHFCAPYVGHSDNETSHISDHIVTTVAGN